MNYLDISSKKEIKDLGVPKFLVNKWLNIGLKKSKFEQAHCQIDNQEDVSVYSESSCSKISSKNVSLSRIMDNNLAMKSKFSWSKSKTKTIFDFQDSRLGTVMHKKRDPKTKISASITSDSSISISDISQCLSTIKEVDIPHLDPTLRNKSYKSSKFKNSWERENEVKLDKILSSSDKHGVPSWVWNDENKDQNDCQLSKSIICSDNLGVPSETINHSYTGLCPPNIWFEEVDECSTDNDADTKHKSLRDTEVHDSNDVIQEGDEIKVRKGLQLLIITSFVLVDLT